MLVGTGGRTRTDMRFNPRKILSLVRLPISPHRRAVDRDLQLPEVHATKKVFGQASLETARPQMIFHNHMNAWLLDWSI
jgi:hypothetical protein